MNLSFAAPWRALACMAAAASVYAIAPPPDALRAGLAIFVLVGGLWMTQALHLSVTALLVPLLAVLAGLMDVRTALASFAHPIIFIFSVASRSRLRCTSRDSTAPWRWASCAWPAAGDCERWG